MKKTFFIILWAISSVLQAQENKISLGLGRILFNDFADTLEKTVPVRIYYSDKWVDSLYLNINTRNTSLDSILSESLRNTGFSFILDGNRLILSKGFEIKTGFIKDYREYLRKRKSFTDTIVYSTLPVSDNQNSINDEYRIFRIGNPASYSKPGNATFSGNLTYAGTDNPVSGAIVFVEKLKVGALTGSDGHFSIEMPKGQYVIEFRMVGLKTIKRNIILYSSGNLDVKLEENTNLLNEVTVSASRENNIREVKMGIEKISVKMLMQLPMGLGEADLFKSSLLLPGVQSAGEASGGFNIRGGGIDQNLILFDGAPVINPSHFFGFFSAFNSDIIQDVTLFKSGIPARYGGRVSSVMDISLKEGSFDKINVSGGFSPLTGRLMIEGPLKKNKTSFIISGRSTYSDWALRMLKNDQLRQSSASFNDIQGMISSDINEKNHISFSAYTSNDLFELYGENNVRYSNLTSTLRWSHRYNDKLSSQVSGILSNYSYQLESVENVFIMNSLNYKLNQNIFRTDFTYMPDDKNTIEAGFDATYYMLSPGIQKPIGLHSEIEDKTLDKEQAIEPSIYISDELEFSPRFVLSGGLRLTMYSFFGPGKKYIYADGLTRSVENITDTIFYDKGNVIRSWPGLEFRVSSRFIITPDLSAKAGFQRNFQYINMMSNTTSMSPTDIWKLSNSYIPPQRGDQISIGLYKNFNSKTLESSIELYYKRIKNIPDYKGGAVLLMNEHIETDILSGKGKAYGVELMLKKQTGKLTGWISYAYSRSLLKVDSKIEEERVNDGNYFPADFDKPHDLKVVANLKVLRRLSFTSNVVYTTGRPITYPVAYYSFYNVNRVFYSSRNEFRIPDYFRVDFSSTLNGNLRAKKLNHSSLTFTVYNLLGRKNPYSIYFKVEDGKVNGYKMSIFGQPIFMLTYNFRIRGNASTDF